MTLGELQHMLDQLATALNHTTEVEFLAKSGSLKPIKSVHLQVAAGCIVIEEGKRK